MKATEPGRVIGMALEPFNGNDEDGKIMVFINPHWFAGSLAGDGSLAATTPSVDGVEMNLFSDFVQKVKEALANLGLYIENGIAQIRELIADKITAREVQTKKLCVEDICVDRNQLKELLEKNQSLVPPPSDGASGGEQNCQPTTEICDGLDNDCDGQVDEDLIQQCGSSNVGACQFGTQTCRAGVWGECQGAVEPIEEICDDGLDNNCDGQIDEGGVCEAAPPAEDVCDATHLNLCLTQAECETAAGFWYNDVCNAQPQNTEPEAPVAPPAPVCDTEHLDLCTTQELCEGASLYWYNETCNLEPEAPACTPDWSCSDWQPLSETVACGQIFKQTRTCTDGCDNEKIEEQELKGTYCQEGNCDLEKGGCQVPAPTETTEGS